MTIALKTARELLDLGARLRGAGDPGVDPPQAIEQLRGAVAVHNILQREGVAYVADEVGTGKTYVALGAIALFRHFDPGFRVAVIAPRENIQLKWMKEWFNFVTHIVRVPDLRVKALHGGPARQLVTCESLRHFIRETTLDPERDFFLRLSSFSLATGSETTDLRDIRSKFKRELPWLDDEVLSLRSKREFKDNLAKAICCVIPEFDLLVVDEAHNLKHGFSEWIAARNRVLAFAFGRQSDEVDLRQFRDYGVRAKRVLMLSATPIEDDYRQLWNQLDVLGKGAGYEGLASPDVSEDEKKDIASRFLIRRVTALESGGQRLTKNLYRREWRRGGVTQHDVPIHVTDPRERLVVALVQKKVAEILNTPQFNATFQMGMLASFESFLETAKVKKSDEDANNFDDAEQTDDEREREGVDVHEIDRLASDFRKKFGGELPHPKMDAMVHELSQSWVTGRKALVFLRRVKSVWELKERLDLAYNTWLAARLRAGFAGNATLASELDELLTTYNQLRGDRRRLLAARGMQAADRDDEQDRGGLDTMFAWFFRGEGPDGWLSGAKFSQRFGQARYALSTFFEDNYAADLLDAAPGRVMDAFSAALKQPLASAGSILAEAAGHYLTSAKHPGRRDFFEAAQAGAIGVIRERASDPELKRRADVIWHKRFHSTKKGDSQGPVQNAARLLETPTFFTALRDPSRGLLRAELWPSPASKKFDDAFVDRELRREMFSAGARLGHAVIDLYVIAMSMRGSIRTADQGDEATDIDEVRLVGKYLDTLESQRSTPLSERGWGAFDELSDASKHFDLILDVNEPRARSAELSEVGRRFGTLFRQQQPIGGMTGQVSKTLVQQFRLPGYPLVLLSTDLLQEGEDLHTFCSDVYHYGIAWTPSALEQRIGRIDRVRSKTERTLTGLIEQPTDGQKLQVYFPHLEDTVERLQVRRVLKRMHEFIRLMHEGLGSAGRESSRCNVAREILDPSDLPPSIDTVLETAFPVREEQLRGRKQSLAITTASGEAWAQRLAAVRNGVDAQIDVRWEPYTDAHSIGGTAFLENGRQQPFILHLRSYHEHVVVRCVSPVGRIHDDWALRKVTERSRRMQAQIGLIDLADDRGGDLTVEEEVLLGDGQHDQARVMWLVRRVVFEADRLEEELWPTSDMSFADVTGQLRAEGRVNADVD